MSTSFNLGVWCNGSTTDSGSVSEDSNSSTPTNNFKHMEIFNKVKEVCGNNLPDLAAGFGYPEDTIALLSLDDEVEFKKKYWKTYTTLLSCQQEKDTRSPFEYGKDIASMWLLEDIAIAQLKKHGVNAQRYGADKDRKILNTKDISAKSDFLVVDDDREMKVEFVIDFTRFWGKTNKIDFRNNKYDKIIDNDSVLFGISLDTGNKDYKKYLLFENLAKYDHTYFNEHPVWKKPANRVSFPNRELRDLDWNEVASRIKKIIEER